MTELDIEGVLAGHRPYPRLGQVDCHGCDWSGTDHRAHVAAVLREQVAEWLESEAVVDLAYDVRDRTGKTGAILSALAAQVAPSREEES